MKSIIVIVLLAALGFAAYTFVYKPSEVEPVEEEVSMITPADMSEAAQAEMYGDIMQYNKCMMQNRLEYHQKGVQIEKVADKTLAACETHLDDLKLVLEANDVNKDLSEGMVKTMRQRAARKLMGNVMQTMAGQAAAAANAAAPVAPEAAVTP